jgi:hypothetical protein
MKKYTLIIMLAFLLTLGSVNIVLAQGTGPKTGVGSGPKSDPSPVNTTNPNGKPSTEDPEKLDDPLGEGVSLEGLLLKLFDIILYVGVPVVAFFLIWSGFMFITAQGSPEKLETARSRLLYTVIGAILLLGAWTISQAIKGTLEDIKSGGTALLSKDIFS